MKTILVAVGGSASDAVVLETALALARPFNSHLEFLHIRIDPGDAAVHTPHLAFVRGAGATSALEELRIETEQRSAQAERHVRDFCHINGVDLHGRPGVEHISAHYREEPGDAMHQLLARARHHDLVVVARPTQPNGLPDDFLERLLLGSGRPMVVAGKRPPEHLTRKVMVCWRETPDAARALTVALPLLAKAEHVVFASVVEGDVEEADMLSGIIHQMKWHGIHASATVAPRNHRSVAEALRTTALACGADLTVMGGYGRGRIREKLFGGCTQAMLDDGDLPILLVH
jgi:nucleotide-binding universal stress UspA family protein